MDRDEHRIESLERRVRHLERQLAKLEARAPAETGSEAAGRDPGTPAPDHAAPRAAARPRPIDGAGSRARTASGVHPAGPTCRCRSHRLSALRSLHRLPRDGPLRSVAPRRASPPDAWPATVARTPISLKDLEERFAGRALAWIGGIALVAAAIFFLSLAFSRGWITEPMRVAIGLTAGIAAFAAGAVLLARRNPLVGNVLAGVGLGIVSVSLFAATRLYGLLPPEAGLAGALVAAIAAAAVAVRYDARSVAAFGLVAALIAPPLMGASPDAPHAPVRRRHAGGLDGGLALPLVALAPVAGLRAGGTAAGQLAGGRPRRDPGGRRVDRLLACQHRRRGRRGGARSGVTTCGRRAPSSSSPTPRSCCGASSSSSTAVSMPGVAPRSRSPRSPTCSWAAGSCSARGGSTCSATWSPAPASPSWRSRPSCSWERPRSRWRGPPRPWRSPGWPCAAVTLVGRRGAHPGGDGDRAPRRGRVSAVGGRHPGRR